MQANKTSKKRKFSIALQNYALIGLPQYVIKIKGSYISIIIRSAVSMKQPDFVLFVSLRRTKTLRLNNTVILKANSCKQTAVLSLHYTETAVGNVGIYLNVFVYYTLGLFLFFDSILSVCVYVFRHKYRLFYL